MTKKEFQNKETALQAEKDVIQQQIDELREQYLNANKPCAIDDIVEVERYRGGKQRGIVVDFIIDSDDNVKPLLRKMKKDGTASYQRLRVWYNDKINYPEKKLAHENDSEKL